jgi:hypothetical protein
MRVRVPYDREGKGLRFHGVPEKVTGIVIITVGFYNASYITGVELAVATAAVLSHSRASLGRTTDSRGRRASNRNELLDDVR